jgi:GNAT superfamily N-acetyltransferase
MKIREMTSEEFWPLVKKNEAKVFRTQQFAAYQNMTAHERRDFEDRKKFIKERLSLNYVLFDGKKLAGWTAGFQTNPNEFYMMSSAVLPKYRRKGNYTKLLKTVLDEAKKRGFQLVTSNHLATNNPVLIAKLKLGFSISGMEVSDQMGVLLKLTYSFNPLRAEILKYRTGELHPTARVKKALKLK